MKDAYCSCECGGIITWLQPVLNTGTLLRISLFTVLCCSINWLSTDKIIGHQCKNNLMVFYLCYDVFQYKKGEIIQFYLVTIKLTFHEFTRRKLQIFRVLCYLESLFNQEFCCSYHTGFCKCNTYF